ncbi:16S rRNA (cytidine(1402)-2'-O)-methyltransferase [Patescibacteria group bacterium]|nr:16S rRNA (cytidine(1402)-2'-O)-methyltransferase [Patescibacteria group bacterium]MBU4030634.1 16S rRNA (cytidine(1402)-2'-O)-methyltransferase [Patescibacteria group bacterium]MBU4082732.1 16S rRNA (cytidine(1402)-2'-O)-methyltransferase [Patescibacteria group bacterium]MCG2809610.1 16S rRNA (cytidine(1402)-2'-O)-methyltransferase [Candidatus Portnoybacteria bacterium]
MKLYIVATPIGNLKDISFRAIETLKKVTLILCEDTRVAQKLLSRYEISKPTVSYHQHSELKKNEYILERLKEGNDLALISDAGTPSISDPGAKLIEFLFEQMPDLEVIPIPGPSALIAALSVSGFSADKFVFLGFPPVKKKRKKFFEEVANSKHTVVFYESCHRILKTLRELESVLEPERQIVVCREITKKFETIYKGEVKEVIEKIEKDKTKGEFVVVVKGK